MIQSIFKVCLLFIISIFVIPFQVVAEGSDGYSIDSYDIDIVVNENNTLNITENIGAYFYTNKHGIFRKIPYSLYLIIYIIGIISVFCLFMCLKYLPKRTPYGNEVLGKIKGFKNFLETAEMPKLEEMVMYDPTYFYNILPYTYVLGVSDKWIKKFETIALQSPDWYDSNSVFDVVAFGSFMNSTMNNASTVMSSAPSTSSSRGSSGGGSSGGGSGGGGGGSW